MVSSDQKSLEIKQDDKFFNRIMSKENSISNSSSRVYYRGVSGSIPFTWESCPGTPKHPLSDYSSSVPPLTPPPSYYSASLPKSTTRKTSLFTNIFLKLLAHKSANKRSNLVSPASSIYSSSPSSSYSSSRPPFHDNFRWTFNTNSKLKKRSYSCDSRSPMTGCNFHDYEYEDDQNVGGGRMIWCNTPLICYGVKRKVSSGFKRFYSTGDMKKAFLSILGHGST